MKESENSKGCLFGVIVLLTFYFVQYIFVKTVSELEPILSSPMVTFGVPILIFLVMFFSSEKKDKKNEKD